LLVLLLFRWRLFERFVGRKEKTGKQVSVREAIKTKRHRLSILIFIAVRTYIPGVATHRR
jgi:hypothetical protein